MKHPSSCLHAHWHSIIYAMSFNVSLGKRLNTPRWTFFLHTGTNRVSKLHLLHQHQRNANRHESMHLSAFLCHLSRHDVSRAFDKSIQFLNCKTNTARGIHDLKVLCCLEKQTLTAGSKWMTRANRCSKNGLLHRLLQDSEDHAHNLPTKIVVTEKEAWTLVPAPAKVHIRCTNMMLNSQDGARILLVQSLHEDTARRVDAKSQIRQTTILLLSSQPPSSGEKQKRSGLSTHRRTTGGPRIMIEDDSNIILACTIPGRQICKTASRMRKVRDRGRDAPEWSTNTHYVHEGNHLEAFNRPSSTFGLFISSFFLTYIAVFDFCVNVAGETNRNCPAWEPGLLILLRQKPEPTNRAEQIPFGEFQVPFLKLQVRCPTLVTDLVSFSRPVMQPALWLCT